MGHLKEAKLASGSIKPVRVSDYFKHMWLGLKETMFLAYATFAAFVHSFFPFLYGFDMIQWQRVCDTDNDGKYGCGDETFDASEEGGVCSS